MRKKKIAILGRGTAGVLAAAQVLGEHNYDIAPEVEWYFDSSLKPQAVGEGTSLVVPEALFKSVGFTHTDLIAVHGTFKHGIDKINWGTGKRFMHEFTPPSVGYHFNAVELQSYLFDKLKDRVKAIDCNITSDQIDADYIIDCSGTPKNPDLLNQAKYIPVNAAYVTQCFWDKPRFLKTLTIARPYGWVFGIPLQNRCSIGYMFNDKINSVEEVREDVKNVFDEFNLIPSTTTNELHFKNYYRKTNFEKNIAYNGNASFFLEPLEATTLSVVTHINRWSESLIKNPLWLTKFNRFYQNRMEKTERVIMLHYFAGSVFKTPFWDFAEERGRKCMEEAVADDNWMKKYEVSKKIEFHKPWGQSKELESLRYKNDGDEDWPEWSYFCNLSSRGLDIYDKIDALKNAQSSDNKN